LRFRTPTFFSAAVACVLALAAALSSQTPPGPSLTLLSREGRRAVPIVLAGDQEMVALDDLATPFQLAVREEAFNAITVTYKGKTIVLTPDQALASVSGRLVSLPAPTARSGRRWLVPVEFISRALSLIYDTRLELRKPSRLLIVGDLRVPRLTVRYDPLGASGRLTLDATPRALATVTQESDHLSIKFEADTIDIANPPLPEQTSKDLLQAVRVVDATTLAVDLGPRFTGFRATSQPVDTTTRLVIDLLGQADTAAPTGAAPPGATPPVTPPPAPLELPPVFGQSSSAIHTIAIDPGHGGEDPGARGVEGAIEKELTLALARRVKGVVEARLGLRVLLTRDDDRNVPVDERTAIANNNKADLFISLHANASLRKAASGAMIFTAAFERDAAANATAGGADRVPTFGGGAREIELVLWDLAQTRHLDRSAAFAGILEQQMRERVPVAAQAIDRAALRVLESANMPAVLVEIGYLTNPEQEALIKSDAFQSALTQSLYEAIVRFRDTLSAGGTH
jgi:N-acetylmuramoyl-L-alanine amidase